MAWLPSTTITREFVPSIFARSKLVSPTASPATKPACWSATRTSGEVGAVPSRAESAAQPALRTSVFVPASRFSAVCRAFVSAELASAHFGSSQTIPPTVAPARRVRATTLRTVSAVDAAQRDHDDGHAGEPVGHGEL